VVNSNNNWQAIVTARNSAGGVELFASESGPSRGTFDQKVSESFTFARCDGLPDDCGTVTQPVAPPGYNRVPDNITYTDEDGTDITIPIGLIYLSPTINVDGTISVPVQISIEDPVLNVENNIDVDFNLSKDEINDVAGPSTGNDPRSGCKDRDYTTDDPIPEPPSGGGAPVGGDPQEPQEERIIRGVVVTVTEQGDPVSEIFSSTDGPDIIVPCAGWINFLVRLGAAGNAWLPDIPVKNSLCFIECPWEGGAIGFAYVPRYGSEATVTPVYSGRELPITDPGSP